MKIERVTAAYLSAQAVLGIVLWVGVETSASVRGWIELTPDHRGVTDAFALPDLTLVVVGSALGAWAITRRRPWAVPVVAFTAGAVVYPTVYLIGIVSISRGAGVVGLGMMVPVSTITCWVAHQTWRTRSDAAAPATARPRD